MLTEEQLELQALAREFATAELRPHTADWDERRAIDYRSRDHLVRYLELWADLLEEELLASETRAERRLERAA